MNKFATAMGRAITGKDAEGAEGAAVTGPSVRVARGNKVTVVPVGAQMTSILSAAVCARALPLPPWP